MMDLSQRRLTKYLNDDKMHSAIFSHFFEKLDHVNDQLYKVELAKTEVAQEEPVVNGFFIHFY